MYGSVYLENAGHQDGTTLLSFIEPMAGQQPAFLLSDVLHFSIQQRLYLYITSLN